MKSSNTNDYRCQRVSLQLIGAVSFAFQGTILDKQIECKGNYIVSFGSNEISNVLIKFINKSANDNHKNKMLNKTYVAEVF